MTETWDDVNEQVKADWKDDITPFKRVYEIVERELVSEGREFRYAAMARFELQPPDGSC
jgi:hypothetical protein